MNSNSNDYDGKEILFEEREHIAYITVNTKMNILNMKATQALTKCLQQAESSIQIKVVVLKSSEDRVFSAGFDLTMFEAGFTPELQSNLMTHGRDISRTLFFMNKPVIAQIQGSAIGMGCIMALAADFRFVADKKDLFFRLPEVDMDMFPITGPTAMAVFQLGQAHAKDMLLSGRKVFLEELDKWGTFTRICAPQDLPHAVEEFAQILAQKKSFLMNTIKPAINLMSFAQAMDWFDVENQLQEFKTSPYGGEMAEVVNKIQSLWDKYGKGAPTFTERSLKL